MRAPRQAVCERAPQAKEAAGASRTARVCEPPCANGAPQGEETTCAREAARVCEPPCVYEARVSERPCVGCVRTACVRSLYTREMSVAMHEHAAASPGVNASMNGNAIECSMGLVARRCARDAWRQRLRLWRDKCRVAAVVAIGTVPGLHGSARVVRAVPRARPARLWLRGLRDPVRKRTR